MNKEEAMVTAETGWVNTILTTVVGFVGAAVLGTIGFVARNFFKRRKEIETKVENHETRIGVLEGVFKTQNDNLQSSVHEVQRDIKALHRRVDEHMVSDGERSIALAEKIGQFTGALQTLTGEVRAIKDKEDKR